MSFQFRTYAKPQPRPDKPKRKALKPKGAKGEFWDFCNEIQNRFYLRIGMPQRCQRCDGTAYCGPLTPAHMKRRQDIRRGNFRDALRTVPLGSYCHYDEDRRGRREAEPRLETLRTESLSRLGITDDTATRILRDIANEIQAEGKYQQFVVEL
jgi:hypothetical protein